VTKMAMFKVEGARMQRAYEARADKARTEANAYLKKLDEVGSSVFQQIRWLPWTVCWMIVATSCWREVEYFTTLARAVKGVETVELDAYEMQQLDAVEEYEAVRAEAARAAAASG